MPTRLAEYRMVGPAGPFGNGPRAWLAEPPLGASSDSPVVIVELDAAGGETWPTTQALLHELASVRSAHVPRLLESGRGEGNEPTTWISRDHPAARSLATAVGDRRAALRVLAGAARGAHDLHEAGWAHGDIRLATVLVDAGEGLLDLPTRLASTVPPAVIRVVDPSDLDGVDSDRLWGAGPTRASDVYALGAALHRALTGAPLHPDLVADQPVTAVQRVLVERPRITPTFDGPVAQLVRECLDPDPARRPPSAAHVADRLDELAVA